MARLYTTQEKMTALLELKIDARNNRVSGNEAARILSWRAKYERGIEHEYKVQTVLWHADKLGARLLSKRKHDYDLDLVFALDIEPSRGKQASTRKRVSEQTENSL